MNLQSPASLITAVCIACVHIACAQSPIELAEKTCIEWNVAQDALNKQWLYGSPEVLTRFEVNHRELLTQGSVQDAEAFLRAVEDCTENDELKLWSSNLRYFSQPNALSNEGFSRLVHQFAAMDDCSKYARIHHLYQSMSSEIVKRPNVFYADILEKLRKQAIEEECAEGEMFIKLTEVYRLTTLSRAEEACLRLKNVELKQGASKHLKEQIIWSQINSNISAKNYYSAIDWLKQRLKQVVASHDTVSTIRTLNDIGVCFYRSDSPDSARSYYKTALQDAQSIDHNVWQGILSGNLGVLLKDGGHFEEAIELLRFDYNKTKDTFDYISGVNALSEISECFLELGMPDSALYWLDVAERQLGKPFCDLGADGRALLRIKHIRYTAYKALDVPRKALKTLEHYEQLKDSLTRLEYRRKTDNLTTVMTAERLESEKRALEDENKLNKQLLKQERTNLLFVLSFAGSVLFVVLALLRSNRIQKKARKETAELLEVTRQQNDKLNNFALIVSHNLRGSAGNIKSLVELLQNDQLGDNKDELLQHLGLASDSLNQTINDLNGLTRSRSESHEMVPIKLYPIVRKVTTDIKDAGQRQDFAIQIDIPQHLSVRGIPAYVESVIYNFTSNAYKYRHPERTPQLSISASKEGDAVLMVFEDNGLGIDLEKHGDELFKLFSTFHGNKEAQGVGLYATRNQVRSMGGSVEVESTPGEGTRFTVTLQSVE